MRSASSSPPASTSGKDSTIRVSTHCFVTLPVSWRGTVAQYVGRLHRLHEAKLEVRVYDYADLDVPMLARMFDRRCRGYEAVGYTIILPAGAIPGWPADVPLPVDPAWKRDYAASVRRLVGDGVQSSLATLFVDAARPLPPDAEGVYRARSASEAFLYRRLQTLPGTAGRFRLNAGLPIPFDAFSGMEVDLLCDKPRVAIELDGPQHLGDPVAYRRDRRKDQFAAGEWLYCSALPRRGCREGSGRGAGCDLACFRKSPAGHYTESTRDDVTVSELRDCFLKRRLGGVDREFPQVRLQVHSVR